MKKALVLVQGIHEHRYIKTALRSSGFDHSVYEKLPYVKTEETFDAFSIEFDWWDKYGDIVKFFFNPFRRKAVCKLLEKKVERLKKLGYEVDIMCHSLGTCIVLCSNVQVDKVYMIGSPLSMKTPILGKMVRDYIKKEMNGFKANLINYVWSERDSVCNYFSKEVQEVLGKATGIINDYNSNSKHNLTRYLKDMTNFEES